MPSTCSSASRDEYRPPRPDGLERTLPRPHPGRAPSPRPEPEVQRSAPAPAGLWEPRATSSAAPRRRQRLRRDAILCMAHYDSVFAGPGIGDDLAGVAAWLAARALARDLCSSETSSSSRTARSRARSALLRRAPSSGARGRGGEPEGRGTEPHVRDRAAVRWAAESRGRVALRLGLRRGLPAHAQRHRLHGVEERGVPGLNFASSVE